LGDASRPAASTAVLLNLWISSKIIDIEINNTIRFHRENDLGMDGAERMLRVTAGRDIECPLSGADGSGESN